MTVSWQTYSCVAAAAGSPRDGSAADARPPLPPRRLGDAYTPIVFYGTDQSSLGLKAEGYTISFNDVREFQQQQPSAIHLIPAPPRWGAIRAAVLLVPAPLPYQGAACRHTLLVRPGLGPRSRTGQ